ncbi:hypothetical protein IV203_030942 [Nitzschia inconspicua]|uniref:Uncharacterized protein n=1 Tax=Nitzschia inconspicua TaxID=303405 RepID=A0A9K3LUE2_9STRA|nr:hypothetical protein IV203_030942 [Nitzschia inconspicua]
MTVTDYFRGRGQLENVTGTNELTEEELLMLSGLGLGEYAVIGETEFSRIKPDPDHDGEACFLSLNKCNYAIMTTCVNYNNVNNGLYDTYMNVWPPGGQSFTEGWAASTQTILSLNSGQFSQVWHKCKDTNLARYKELRAEPSLYSAFTK